MKKSYPPLDDASLSCEGYDDMLFNHQKGMSRQQIALDTLARYSGSGIEHFQKFIFLTNFPNYVDAFCDVANAKIHQGSVLRVAHSESESMSLIDYRVGAPMAALVIDVLSYLKPQAVVMLGMCGGLHRQQKIGDFLVPTAAIRDEGVSKYYIPSEVPSLPALMVQYYLSQTMLAHHKRFFTGVVHSTDYRMWEFDVDFKRKLKREKATAIDMECSALFSVGFARKVPVGALMLVSDLPLQVDGIKTKKSASKVFALYTNLHLTLGIEAMVHMQKATHEKNINFRHYQFL